MFDIRRALPEDAFVLAPHLRASDIAESYAANGKYAIWNLLDGVDRGGFVGMIDGKPFCMFGCVDFGDAGIPWMLATRDIYRYPFAFLAESRRLVNEWKAKHKMLSNYVDSRNVEAIRWLKWLGFEMGEPKPYGPFGIEFIPFSWRCGDV